jgi:UDP-glucuronate 4-epimerase
MAMRVLLTGAAGFIGSHLADRLCAQGHSVVGLDNFDAFYPRARKERNLAGLRDHGVFLLQEGDLGTPADLERALGAAGGPVDVVIHMAALAGIAASLAAPERFFEVNVMGTLRLIEAAKRAGVTRFVFASSSSVYGADSPLPFREDAVCGSPLSPYAASKRAGELLAYGAHHLHHMAVTSLRFFTVFGPRQRPDLAIHKFTNLISRGQAIELNGDGSSERDYTYVDDIVDGVMAAVAQQQADPLPRHRVYNLGGSRAVPLVRLVELLSELLGTKPQIIWRPERPEDMRRTLADVSLAHAQLGYQPQVSLEEGLARFAAWWRQENPPLA